MRKKEPASMEDNIAHQLGRVARALEREQMLWRKFLNGILLGLGTAIGASVIAGLVILLLSQLFKLFGLELPEIR
jgi:hypothetical protein